MEQNDKKVLNKLDTDLKPQPASSNNTKLVHDEIRDKDVPSVGAVILKRSPHIEQSEQRRLHNKLIPEISEIPTIDDGLWKYQYGASLDCIMGGFSDATFSTAYTFASPVADDLNIYKEITDVNGLSLPLIRNVVQGDKKSDDYNISNVRGVGISTPHVVAGWGYNVDGTPTILLDKDKFDSDNYDVGPMDLRWDEKRGVWRESNIILSYNGGRLRPYHESTRVSSGDTSSPYTGHLNTALSVLYDSKNIDNRVGLNLDADMIDTRSDVILPSGQLLNTMIRLDTDLHPSGQQYETTGGQILTGVGRADLHYDVHFNAFHRQNTFLTNIDYSTQDGPLWMDGFFKEDVGGFYRELKIFRRDNSGSVFSVDRVAEIDFSPRPISDCHKDQSALRHQLYMGGLIFDGVDFFNKENWKVWVDVPLVVDNNEFVPHTGYNNRSTKVFAHATDFVEEDFWEMGQYNDLFYVLPGEAESAKNPIRKIPDKIIPTDDEESFVPDAVKPPVKIENSVSRLMLNITPGKSYYSGDENNSLDIQSRSSEIARLGGIFGVLASPKGCSKHIIGTTNITSQTRGKNILEGHLNDAVNFYYNSGFDGPVLFQPEPMSPSAPAGKPVKGIMWFDETVTQDNDSTPGAWRPVVRLPVDVIDIPPPDFPTIEAPPPGKPQKGKPPITPSGGKPPDSPSGGGNVKKDPKPGPGKVITPGDSGGGLGVGDSDGNTSTIDGGKDGNKPGIKVTDKYGMPTIEAGFVVGKGENKTQGISMVTFEPSPGFEINKEEVSILDDKLDKIKQRRNSLANELSSLQRRIATMEASAGPTIGDPFGVGFVPDKDYERVQELMRLISELDKQIAALEQEIYKARQKKAKEVSSQVDCKKVVGTNSGTFTHDIIGQFIDNNDVSANEKNGAFILGQLNVASIPGMHNDNTVTGTPTVSFYSPDGNSKGVSTPCGTHAISKQASIAFDPDDSVFNIASPSINFDATTVTINDESIVTGSFTEGSVLFGDTDTGIAEDNSNFFWDNANNRLGIGTSSPTVDFETTGAGLFGSTIQVGGGSGPTLEADGAELVFDISGTDVATIDAAGQIGLGTLDPQATFDLAYDNTGVGNASFRISDTDGTAPGADSVPAAYFNFQNTNKFEVSRGWHWTDGANSYSHDSNGEMIRMVDGIISFLSSTSLTPGNTSEFLTEQVTIDAAGQVGFGTTDIQAAFDVTHDNTGIGNASIRISDTAGTSPSADSVSAAYLNFQNNNKFDITRGWHITEGSDTYSHDSNAEMIRMDAGIISFWSSTGLTPNTNSESLTERMTIDSDGQIGINDSSPSFQLDVNGTGQFTDAVTIGSYTLLNTDGTADQVLITDGAGTLAWGDVSDISGAVVERYYEEVFTATTTKSFTHGFGVGVSITLLDASYAEVDCEIQHTSLNAATLTFVGTITDYTVIAIAANDDNYLLDAMWVESSPYVIVHNLGLFPDVTVVDEWGYLVDCEIQYDSANQITLGFVGTMSGSAILHGGTNGNRYKSTKYTLDTAGFETPIHNIGKFSHTTVYDDSDLVMTAEVTQTYKDETTVTSDSAVTFSVLSTSGSINIP